MITDSQIQRIKGDILQKGINMPGLESDILDHLLCSIEENMTKGQSFEEAYQMAAFQLHGDSQIITIQKETISALNEGKSIWRNLMNYGITLALLILIFNLLTTGVNPALILVCISLSIFFVYHGIFQARKQHSLKRNLGLFLVITGIAVIGVFVFVFLEFNGGGLVGMLFWSTLIMGVAIPVYLKAVKKVLLMDSTLTTFFSYSLKLIALMSLLWIPLALAIKVYRPDVAVLFFVDDLFVLAIIAFILSTAVKKIVYLKVFLKKNL
jgi:hypothetical protein